MIGTVIRQAVKAVLLLSVIALDPAWSHEHSRDDHSHLDESALQANLVAAVRQLIDAIDEDAGFVESLYGLSRHDALIHAFDSHDRDDWSYWPRKRTGLALGEMTAEQRMRTRAVLSTVLSAKGYLQVHHIIMLEEVLADLETVGFQRGAENYTVAVFGTPSTEKPWAFRFEGHHISINLTVTQNGIFVTPSFFGAAPARRSAGPQAGFGPLAYEQNAAFALLQSLSPAQRSIAILSDKAPQEIFSSPFRLERAKWNEWKSVLEPDGIAIADLTSKQKALLHDLLGQILGAYRGAIVHEYLKEIDRDTLRFAWMGGTEGGEPHYFRMQSKRFVFEFDAAQENGNHIHMVWRDRRNDFAADWLSRHYRQTEHQAQ